MILKKKDKANTRSGSEFSNKEKLQDAKLFV